MILDKVSQNISQYRQYVVLGIFLFLIFVPSFFSGEWNRWLQVVIYVIVFLLLLYTVILNKDSNHLTAPPKKYFSSPAFYLIIFLAVVLITSFLSSNKYNSFSQFFLLASFAAIFFSAGFFFRQWKYVVITVQMIFSTGILTAAISLFMFFSQSYDRATGLIFNANALGGYLLFSLPLGVVLLTTCRSKKLKIFYSFGLLFIILSFALSYSISAWFSFIVPLVMLAVFYRKTLFTRRNVSVVAIAIIVLFLALAGFRYTQTKDFGESLAVHKVISSEHAIHSISQRLNFNSSSWEIFKDNVWTGSGYNTYQMTYSRYYRTILEQPRYAHNYYLQTAAEIGVFGFLILILFIIFLLINSLKAVKQEVDPSKKVILLGLGLGVVGSAIHALFDFGWQFPAVFILFWLESGMLMAWAKRLKIKELEDQPVSGNPLKKKIIQTAVIIIALIIFIRGVSYGLGTYYFHNAERAASRGEIEELTGNYLNGLMFDPEPMKTVNYVQERIKYSRALNQDDYQDLETVLKEAMPLGEKNYFIYWVLGKVYLLQDKYTAAEAEYKKAIELNPVFRPDFYYDLAFLYFEQNEYDKVRQTAFSILDKYYYGIASSNPNLRTQLAFLNLIVGETYFKEGNIARAEYYYNQSLKWKPDFPLVQNKLKELE